MSFNCSRLTEYNSGIIGHHAWSAVCMVFLVFLRRQVEAGGPNSSLLSCQVAWHFRGVMWLLGCCADWSSCSIQRWQSILRIQGLCFIWGLGFNLTRQVTFGSFGKSVCSASLCARSVALLHPIAGSSFLQRTLVLHRFADSSSVSLVKVPLPRWFRRALCYNLPCSRDDQAPSFTQLCLQFPPP